MPTFPNRVVCVLFFLISLKPQAYCTTALGLKIDLQANTRARGSNKSDVPEISNLTDIEITDSEHNNTIEEDVTYTFLSNDASFADTDTDDDEESAIQNSASQVVASMVELMPGATLDIKELNKYNWSRNPPPLSKARDKAYVPKSYDPKNNYFKTDFVVEELRTQLSQEALTIVGSEPNSTT
jgi:hypothetical protein